MIAVAWQLDWRGTLIAYSLPALAAGLVWWLMRRAARKDAERVAGIEANRRNREAHDQLAARPNLSPDVARILAELDRRYYDREFTHIIRAEAMRQHPSNRERKP